MTEVSEAALTSKALSVSVTVAVEKRGKLDDKGKSSNDSFERDGHDGCVRERDD